MLLDMQEFILTGRDLDPILDNAPLECPLSRPPQMLETSLPAVFAVGDIHSGTVKRVASAVGKFNFDPPRAARAGGNVRFR